MKILKLSSDTVDGGQSVNTDEEVQALMQIFRSIGEGNLTDNTHRVTDWNIEIRDEADSGGTNYIAISFDKWKGFFWVEKYYESEFMNNEYGKSSKVIPDFGNPLGTADRIRAMIQQMKVGT